MLSVLTLPFAFTAHQDAMETKRLKLDYEEITPCLKDVTVVWDEMLATPDRAKVKFDRSKLNEAVKAGKDIKNQA